MSYTVLLYLSLHLKFAVYKKKLFVPGFKSPDIRNLNLNSSFSSFYSNFSTFFKLCVMQRHVHMHKQKVSGQKIKPLVRGNKRACLKKIYL